MWLREKIESSHPGPIRWTILPLQWDDPELESPERDQVCFNFNLTRATYLTEVLLNHKEVDWKCYMELRIKYSTQFCGFD